MDEQPLRHNLWRIGSSGWQYGCWHIAPAGWRRPHPSVDWDWWHDDFDGAPDSGDSRCGSAADRDACIAAIHEWEDDNAPEPPAIYVRFSDDGRHIRKWAFDPFEQGRRYIPAFEPTWENPDGPQAA